MAATVQQATTTNTNNNHTPGGNAAPNLTQNPRLKRIVYSKYRELLGSYNDKANAIIETLPAYMVQEDRGFNFEPSLLQQQVDDRMIYGAPPAPSMSGGIPTQRLPTQQQTYEAPACVQNAMMTKDKKPFTYTPGGIDLSQIKSERMAKRLARNAQAEGATGASQMNRPTQPLSPAGCSPAAASMGAAAMGMPFQVFPTGPPAAPPPPTTAGKQHQNFNGSAGAPPPPPPPNNTTTTLAPPTNNKNGSTLIAPSSPNAARKSPTPQRFEPPPMGFRPEIKIPANPMAALKKVAPPVEKNNFWVEEYRKERSKSPMVGENDSNLQNNSNGSHEYSNNNDDYKKSFTPTMTTPQQQPATNNYNNNNNNISNNYQQYSPQAQQTYSPPTPQQQSPRPEFRSVAAPQSPTVNVYTQNQTDSSPVQQQQQRATESPFRFAQQQSRPMQPISPLAQQHAHQQQQQQQQQTPSTAHATHSPTHAAQQQTAPSSAVPWRTQRSPQPPQAHQQQHQQQQQQQQQQQHPQQQQHHPQPIYNNVRSREVFSPAPETTAAPYQGPKPTNVGSLYIAPLAPTIDLQAQNIVRQQMQQQAAAAQRDSPMRQMPQQQQQQRQPPTARWMSSQAAPKEQPAWARPEENGNVMPSTLQRMKSPEPMQQQQQQQQQQRYQPAQGNGYATAPTTSGQNFGSQVSAPTGLRLQINVGSSNPNGPKERIIPIQLEQTPTPTHTPSQPSFGTQGGNAAPTSYVLRSPNQFVDQGYNNYPAAPQQQMNASRVVQQQQQGNTTNVGGVKTRIIPIALEGDGTRGPISQSPIVIQNDQRTTPVQSKSFRILQKITDTIDGDDNKVAAEATSAPIESLNNAEPLLQRPQFARQMSAQQARNSPTIEQMRRLQIAQEQLPALNQGNSAAMKQTQPNKYVQQPIYNNEDKPQQYVHPSEQHVPEPKKYTGSAIPSRSFKILQAMTTPENAAEMEDSDSIVVELNDKHKPTDNNSNQNQTTTSNINSNCKNCAWTTSTPNPTPPPTSSSTSSLNSEHSSSAHSPHPFHAYPPPYAYPWCPPMPPPGHMPNIGEQLPPNWNYPFPIPPPPPQANGETTPNWHYPYPLPHPMPPKHAGDNTAHPHYPPYPYFYPYYPPPPHMAHAPPTQTSSSASSIEYDSQNAFDPRSYAYHPSYPYPPYPYPIITTNSQSSNPSSSASSVLPDIIVTPSNDDSPSEVMYQHNMKVEKRETPKHSVEISEVSTQQSTPMHREQREGSVIDMLTKRLNEIKQPNEQASITETESRQKTVAELKKEFDKQSSPNDKNKSTVMPDTCVDDEGSSSSESFEESSESTASIDDETTKDDSKQRPGLKSIKSVTNVQVYNGREREQELEQEDEEEDEDDVTSADGESDIFDEEDEECEISSTGAELELDECIEENDDDDLLEQDYLSVIYEEESEMEKSGDTRTAYRNDISSNSSEATTIDNKNLEREIEENDDDDDEGDKSLYNKADEETAEDTNSVTVRLPLKFSFSRSSNDENIATVEVGNSQIEERRNSLSIEEKRSSSFSVAKLNLEDEEENEEEVEHEYEDDCDVSVTISLTPSSRSASFNNASEPRFIYNKEPLTDEPKQIKVADCTVDESSSEDVSVSFSLNMRNKFLDQTISGETTNNIAKLKNMVEEAAKSTAKCMPIVKAEPAEELDFFAMLRATKMQAQQMQEHSASYWGKSADKTTDIEAEKMSETICEKATSLTENIANLETTAEELEEEAVEDEIEDIWASRDDDDYVPPKIAIKTDTLTSARNNFWSTVQEAATERCEVAHDERVEPLEEDFWAVNAKSKAEEQTQFVKQNMQIVQYWTTTLKSQEEAMPRSQKADLTIQAEEEKESATLEKKLKSSTKKSDKEKKSSTRKKKKAEVKLDQEQAKIDEPKIAEPKMHIKKVKETTVVQEVFFGTLNAKPEEQKMQVEQVCESTTVQEDYWSTKTEEQQIQGAETVEEDYWSTLNKITEVKKNQVDKESESSVVQEDVRSTFKQPANNKQIITPKLTLQEESEINCWADREETARITEAIETEEAELDFWADIEESKSSARVCESLYDTDKYPEEPREVDTDEEIDFWAEIEKKNNQSNDDITFHKAANFWASRDRQNSVDETPYKPLAKTAFHARLPDEPSVDMQAWAAALEAAKGEEPEIIDPAVEEEKMLVKEFNNLPADIQVIPEENQDNYTDNNGYVAEEFVADVCNGAQTEVHTEVPAREEQPNFWPTNENEKQVDDTVKIEADEREELEMKRNNYRKAMAFFTTSVDEQKEQKIIRGAGERKSLNRNKANDAEATSWDWKAMETTTQEDAQINVPEPYFNTATSSEIEQQAAQEDNEEQTSDRNTTPTNFEQTQLSTYNEPPIEAYQETLTKNKPLSNGLPDLGLHKASDEQKPSVRERIHAFETGTVEPLEHKKLDIKMQSLSVESYSPKSSISRNSQRSESEQEEEDSGVTDMNKQLSETDTESESFPELRKMTSYQRAATHSRLFKLLQDDNDEETEKPTPSQEEQLIADEFQLKPSRRKIVHNVSITRRQNPKALQNAESMSERRERLSLPLRQKNSIDADNPSTPNSPASPILGQPNNRVVSDKLVNELVQSLLLKRDSSHLRTLPMEKLQAAAKRVLEEEMDSLENSSVETTPAPTPKSAKTDRSYADYYDSWSDATGTADIVPSKAFRALQDRPKRSPWSVKCPRVLSSKTINRDLTRVTESPEIVSRSSKSPERLVRESPDLDNRIYNYFFNQ